MYNRPFTPEFITVLKPHEIFVFGCNPQGMHGGGAARMAYEQFGAWDASDPDSHNSGSTKPSILSKWIKKNLSSNSRN